MDRGDRQFVGVEAAPGVTAVTMDDGLQVDLADALEMADEEGVDGDEVAGLTGLDVAFAEPGAEPFQQPDLFVRKLDPAFRRGLFQPEQPLLLGQQVMAGPHAAYPGR